MTNILGDIGLVCLAIGLFALVCSIGLCFEDAFVKIYDKFDAFMEHIIDKIFAS